MIFILPNTMDDPPSPADLEWWAQVRGHGRSRFILLSTFWMTVVGVWLTLLANGILYVFWERGMFAGNFNGSEVSFPMIFLVVGWLTARERWTKNEMVYLTAVQEKKS